MAWPCQQNVELRNPRLTPKNDLHEAERKEIQAIEVMAFAETFRVDLWRMIVTSILLITAVAITITTFYFLDREKSRNFDTAVRLLEVCC